MSDAIIVVRNYGEKETKTSSDSSGTFEYTAWYVTFEVSTLTELKKEECDKIKAELKKHIELGEKRWASPSDYPKHTEYLKRRISILENADTTCDKVSSLFDDICCVPIPEGADIDEFKTSLKNVWNVGYNRGWYEGTR